MHAAAKHTRRREEQGAVSFAGGARDVVDRAVVRRPAVRSHTHLVRYDPAARHGGFLSPLQPLRSRGMHACIPAHAKGTPPWPGPAACQGRRLPVDGKLATPLLPSTCVRAAPQLIAAGWSASTAAMF
jgi:hypothetical protein